MSRFYKCHQFDKDIVKEIQSLYLLDNIHGVLALASNFLIIAAIIAITLISNWLFYPLAILVIGSRQRALATILHESAHGTLTRNSTLSFILGTFCSGYLIFSTHFTYRHSHVRLRHGNFGDPLKDEDYRYMLSKGIYDIMSPRRYTTRFFVIPCLLLNIPSYLFYIIKSRLYSNVTSKAKYEIVILAIFWVIIFSTTAISGLFWSLLLFWIIPYLTTFQIIGWFIELSEHAPLMENNIDIHMTRNRNSHWLEKIFTGMHGECYHLAHHLRPRVPFWRLKKLHQILMNDPEYAQWDKLSGGIFLSSNNAPSIISLLRQRVRWKYKYSLKV